MNAVDVAKVVAKEVKNQIKQIMAVQGKYDKKRKRDSGSEKSQLFSQGRMKGLYSDAQWEHRLTNVKNRVPPADNPELYEKDVYPTSEDGKSPGTDAKPACVFCRKLGHTVLDCHVLAKRASK